jgi:hypothetical protein
MKKHFILQLAVLFIVVNSCKKNNKETEPPVTPETQKKWMVTTIAGDGTQGFGNGPALSAKFRFPEDVVMLANGTAYVTDVVNACIRKIEAGQVSTMAGGSGNGNGNLIINGPGNLAQFKNPYSITADANGNLYTTDENDPRIRKITPAAVVSTFAGTAIPGFADGNSNTAQFSQGNSIVADAQGNVYVADAANGRIRKVSSAGVVTTIAGSANGGFMDGNGATAKFSSAGAITLDNKGNLYVVDRGNFRIRKISAAGDVSTIAGTGVQGFKDGNAAEAQFSQDMHDIAIDDKGNLYVQDWNRIRKITAQGIVSTIAGSTEGYIDGEGSVAKFNFLAGMDIDAKGNLYIADLANVRIRKVSFQ